MGEPTYVCMSVDCGRRSEEGSPCAVCFFSPGGSRACGGPSMQQPIDEGARGRPGTRPRLELELGEVHESEE